MLTFKMLIITKPDNILTFFKIIRLEMSCELTIHLTCQILFSLKNKKNNVMSSATILFRALKSKILQNKTDRIHWTPASVLF